jgi:hypothetical protein
LEQICYGLSITQSTGHEEEKKSLMAEAKNLRCNFEVSLDGLELELALSLGAGDLTLGIRRAIVLASMRQF